MKNLLFFLLGFVLFFAFLLPAHAIQPGLNKCTDTCIYWQITVSDYNPGYVQCNTYSGTGWPLDSTPCTNTSAYSSTGCGVLQVNFLQFKWSTLVSPAAWVANGSTISKYVRKNVTSGVSAPTPNLAPSVAYPSGPPINCAADCADSDSDGLCDVCDDAPNDSTVGPTKYVRGYYELNDGTTVATIYSYSPTDKTNDLVTIDKKYNYPDKFPGLVYAVGMASYIDEKEFIKGGGRFAGLSKAEPVYTMKCNAIESLDQCTNAICDITDGAPEILEKLEDVEENGEAQAYPTEQKAADAPYLDLDKTCDELRTKCNSSCGAATNVKSFGCSENKHMVCECLNNGTWEVADDWDELGVTIDQSETTTNNYYGEGDSTTGGGSVTGVSDDGTGGFTGSYEYVEGSYNYDSFGSHYSQLASKFPFSLRTTIGSIYSDFKGSGAAPVYYYTIYGHSVTIDLSSFDDIAKMIRSIFALGITLSTMIMLIYLYVGIDLRGK